MDKCDTVNFFVLINLDIILSKTDEDEEEEEEDNDPSKYRLLLGQCH